MVNRFSFSTIPKIIFGPGKLSELSSIAGRNADRILLVTGSTSHRNNIRLLDQVAALENMGKKVYRTYINQEPTVPMIDQAVSDLRDQKIDLAVAVGGGSALDAGKSLSAMLPVTGTIADYLEGAVNFIPHPGTCIPFIAVPTTAGTGSEATKNAVISEIGISGFKRSLRHDNFMPKVALVDPELSQTCPKAVTACSGMDALTQLLESFVSVQANPLSDAFAVSGLKHLAVSLERAFDDGYDIMARSGMSYAALCSGVCLANAGLGTVHGFASSVGGRYNIPHGLICGTLLATVTEKTIGKLRTMDEDSDAIGKYAEAGQILHNSNNRSTEFYLDFLIDELQRLTAKFGIPKLSQFGFDESEVTIIAKKTSCKNNPVQQTVEELIEILEDRV